MAWEAFDGAGQLGEVQYEDVQVPIMVAWEALFVLRFFFVFSFSFLYRSYAGASVLE